MTVDSAYFIIGLGLLIIRGSSNGGLTADAKKKTIEFGLNSKNFVQKYGGNDIVKVYGALDSSQEQ